jgi:endonuclease-8
VPEGDTIFRAARTLHAALAGRTVTRFASSLPQVAAAARHYRIEGRVVRAVEARGKHLIVRFETGPSLHTHMRMTGSWHLYRAGTLWRKGAALARAVIESGDRVAVCFSAPVVEWLTPAQEAEHGPLATLGPDLLSPAFDAVSARANLRARTCARARHRRSARRSRTSALSPALGTCTSPRRSSCAASTRSRGSRRSTTRRSTAWSRRPSAR